jgi:DNA polymerase-1
MKPVTKDAVELFLQGTLALSKVESNGILIDQSYLKRTLYKTAKEIKQLETELREDQIFTIWKKRFGSKQQLGSHQQLEVVIFDELGHKRTGRVTTKGQNKADQSAFEFVDIPFVKKYFKCEKLKKARGTYLLGIEREMVNGRIHPFSNLHIAVSLRSSMDRPSFQNFPIRDPLQAELIRRCVIAPKGYRVGEVDISGNEVRWSAVYHGDPKMIQYITDPTTDMHRDMAMECYLLDKHEVSKMTRYVAKNRFVFPQFYGSWWYECAKSMWEAIDLYSLKTEKGEISLRKHLKKKGIKALGEPKGMVGKKISGRLETEKGTFMEHLRLVQEAFWGERFKVYAQWKIDWWEKFCERGWFRYKTGFIGSGLLDRKQTCNYPVQGSAFHGELWSMIQLQNWLEKKKMKTKIIAQIHDSIIMYLHHSEIDDVLAKAKEIMTKKLLEHWTYINVPFEIEAEVAPKGGSWHDKNPYTIKD